MYALNIATWPQIALEICILFVASQIRFVFVFNRKCDINLKFTICLFFWSFTVHWTAISCSSINTNTPNDVCGWSCWTGVPLDSSSVSTHLVTLYGNRQKPVRFQTSYPVMFTIFRTNFVSKELWCVFLKTSS